MSENQQQKEAEAEAKAKAEAEAKAKKVSGRPLRILKSCGVSGENIEARRKPYMVPGDITEADAKILVRMKRAQWVED